MFEQQLREKGLKITPQRIAILREIQNKGHATVDEIYESIFAVYPSISLATIYKNLNSMCEFGIVNEVKPPLQKQRYEINNVPHSHLVCQLCGSLQDLDLETKDLLESKKIPLNFEITSATVTFYGICKQCKQKQS